MNLTVLTGRLTRDVESRSTSNGGTVFNFGLAVPEGKDEVMFVEVDAWDNVASGISPYLTKGKGIEVAGRLKISKWEDKTTGVERMGVKIIANQLTFSPGGTSKKESESEGEVKAEPKPKTSAGKAVSGKKAGKTAAPVAVTVEEDNEEDDNVPFN